MANFKPKPEHDYLVFNREFKEEKTGDIILFYGEEDYLIQWAVDLYVRKYVDENAKEFDYIKLSEECTADEIIQACDTFSMFSEKRVVWVRNYPWLKSQNPRGVSQQDKEMILNYLNNPNEGAILIFSHENTDTKLELYKTIKRIGKCYNFTKLEEKQFTAFCEKRFRSAGVGISRQTLKYLVEQSGYTHKDTEYRIYNAVNDIEKIIAYSDGIEVTEHDVSVTINGDLDTFIFDFLDAISSNKKAQGFEMLENIISAGEDVFNLIGSLISHFELILDAKELKNDGMTPLQIASELGMHEFRVKKACSYADRFDVTRLKKILSQMYETDRNIKRGLLDQRTALELLVGRI